MNKRTRIRFERDGDQRDSLVRPNRLDMHILYTTPHSSILAREYPSRSVFFVMTDQEPFSVKVTVMDGNSFVTSCRSTDTVSMLKEKIAETSAIPVDHQRAIFRGRVLHDEETLAECNIERDCVVYVVKQSVWVEEVAEV